MRATIKNPLSGNDMKFQTRRDTLVFRKEEFEFAYHFFFDETTGDEFTTYELDEINTQQVYNQYRAKYHIPFPDEIRAIREMYGLPANKMAEVLGFGVNVYRNYESGEVPTVANGRYIQRMKDPAEFFETLIESNVYQGAELEEKKLHILQLIEKRKSDSWSNLKEYLWAGRYPDKFNGYKNPDIRKFLNMAVYFSANISGLAKTKINKLLFYADFLHFKRTANSISGMDYIAIQYGPVPENYDLLFAEGVKHNMLDIRVRIWEGDKEVHSFYPKSEYQFDEDIFSDSEKEALRMVVEQLGSKSTSEIIELSHYEKAWIDNEARQDKISYGYAFELKSVG